MRRAPIAALLVSAASMLLLSVAPARALPLYMARAGRACDNCHTDPTGWKNPKLVHRKCNLSCSSCHINPTGGGMRTAAGRFYGQSTLPMLLGSHRPDKDRRRNLIRALAESNRRNRIGDPAFGRPVGGSATWAQDEARYAGLRADPAVLAGIDARVASWFNEGRAFFFPMQLDIHLAARPVRHTTLYASGGVLAKSQGFSTTFALGCDSDAVSCSNRGRGTPFMVKDLFIMAHQLPLMSYLRVGRFLPPFGLMFDDHTIPTRRDLELDHGLMHSRVTGVEVGMAPNYPYFHFAVFRPNRKDRFVDDPEVTSVEALPPLLGVSGLGLATSFGWRALGFQVGISAMLRSRELADGGDTRTLALSVGFNPWYYVDVLPLTYLAEIAVGNRQRAGSGATTGQIAAAQELCYLAFNGFNLRVRHDYSDIDTEVEADHYHRFAFGADLVLLPGLGLSGMVRVQRNAGEVGSTTTDGLVYVRGWY